ncbi:replicative DNA helicase [Candidatus Hepatoplasma crinochetorum]|uniref:Replicative DNA helicase n=1 Tax=Candidatus Hepatoplasma crinochetorum Av TaxID=1427984 RepID=W8GIS6_9MOLU|nr:replicative DNA helicase [Candidatus Hepatoplasma crinochetorum]AHK22147.1 Replicative DNA helicase [Candidatus Hepatoplasma crinochetorum Av]BDV02730.1 MAG: replicative DNA helicase [Candidatus Hepatoplasma crinochetorum]
MQTDDTNYYKDNEIYSKETEKAILGLLISNPTLLAKCSGKLKIEHFFNYDYRLVYQTLLDNFENKLKIDSTLLIDLLSKSKSGKNTNYWKQLIFDILFDKGIESNLSEYIQTIQDKKQLRDLNLTLKESIKNIYENQNNPQFVIEKIEGDIFSITKDRELKDFVNINDLTNTYLDKLEKIKKSGYQEGIRVKLNQFDNLLGGFKKSEFIVLAGRPSMGKTAVALQFIFNISNTKKVALFSLEMPSESIIQRFISNDSMVSQDELRNYDNLNQNKLLRIDNSISTLKKKLIWIDDKAGMKIGELIWKIRKLHSEAQLDIVFIDYLQLIESENIRYESRQESISNISRIIKSLARELNIPIVALSQLSRKVETREEKRPMMSDLRESGAIEQDADVVLLLYRPKYYNNKDDDFKNSIVEELEIIIAKNRNGKTGIANLDINMEIGKITSSN